MQFFFGCSQEVGAYCLLCVVYRYGDVTAQNHKEELLSILTMLVGMTLLMGVILGGLSSILTNYYTQKAAFIHRVETINACLVSCSHHTLINQSINQSELFKVA